MTKICKILLVEDQPDLQELLRELFADEGYRFLIVGNGTAMREAILTDRDIDIVVLDILLPGGLDGLTLAREVADQGLPVIIVTGDHRHAETLETSGHHYLLKPFPIASFLELIETVLRDTAANCRREQGEPEKKAVPASRSRSARRKEALAQAGRDNVQPSNTPVSLG